MCEVCDTKFVICDHCNGTGVEPTYKDRPESNVFGNFDCNLCMDMGKTYPKAILN